MSEIAAWERQRNATRAQVKWMFTTEKARAKMGRAYPEPASIKAHPTKESLSLCNGTSDLAQDEPFRNAAHCRIKAGPVPILKEYT